MEELSSYEIDEVSGGRPPWWAILEWVSEFSEGFAAGWAAGARSGGSDGWTMPNGESLPT